MSSAAEVERSPWRDASFCRRMLACVFIGFTSGLPLYTLLSLVPVWLRSEHVDLKSISMVSLTQMPYLLKFLWAPLADRYALTSLGRRRSWMLLSQSGLLLCMAQLGYLDPQQDLEVILRLATVIAVFGATQDIAIDAYRREILHQEEFGVGNAVFVNAYRIAGLVPGSFALVLADHIPWTAVFVVNALFLLPGMAFALVAREPVEAASPRTLLESVIKPFKEFIGRQGWRAALFMLAFVVFYKLGDSMATALATTFYLDMGFTKSQIGIIAKNAGLWPSVIGSLVGGVWMIKLGINRALWLFGAVQLLSILGFALLSSMPGNTVALALVIAFEAVGVGLGATALVAYMSRSTHPAYAAFQFALFTALASVPRVLFSAKAGTLVEALGWFDYFLLCALLGIPGMLLLFKVAPWNGDRMATPAATSSSAGTGR